MNDHDLELERELTILERDYQDLANRKDGLENDLYDAERRIRWLEEDVSIIEADLSHAEQQFKQVMEKLSAMNSIAMLSLPQSVLTYWERMKKEEK